MDRTWKIENYKQVSYVIGKLAVARQNAIMKHDCSGWHVQTTEYSPTACKL